MVVEDENVGNEGQTNATVQRREEEFKRKLTEEGKAIVVEESKGRIGRDKVGGRKGGRSTYIGEKWEPSERAIKEGETVVEEHCAISHRDCKGRREATAE